MGTEKLVWLMGIGGTFIAAEECGASDAAASGEERWYAVQCLPRRENVAAINLERQAFGVFCPRRRVTRRHARKLETVLAPYFPGYLFVRLNLTKDRWRSVNGTLGVVKIVAFGKEPAPVPKGVVEALQDRCNTHGIMAGNEPIRIGRQVQLSAGPFAEFVAKVDSLDERGRVRVLLEMLGGKVAVTVPQDFLTVSQ